jgi:hypothetical protein
MAKVRPARSRGPAVKRSAAIAVAGAPSLAAGLPQARLRKMRIVAQDPSVLVGGARGGILTAEVDVPAEELAPGPRGYRVHVIDYDASSGHLYAPLEYRPPVPGSRDWLENPAAPVSDATILGDPGFHAQNVYAVVMRTLARFEFALGRRVGWGFDSPGHQIKVAPHAFADANAFYSRRDEALMFGHFPARDGSRDVFTCLSHDVVAHETTHALLDGLRKRYMEPSSPDQAAFHEAFADVVALLSVFALPEVVRLLIDRHLEARGQSDPKAPLRAADVARDRLARSVLLAIGEEFGQEMGPVSQSALRHSAGLPPSPEYYTRPGEFEEPHRRGEILVAAVMNAFLSVWAHRLEALVSDQARTVDRTRAAEEGSVVADELLTLAIRALDYCPPVHLEFATFLSAMRTADREVRPVDDRYRFREHLLEAFRAFGITHASLDAGGRPLPAPEWEQAKAVYSYDRTRFESMQRDPDEVFRFAWENRDALRLHDAAYTRVISVRPCVRLAPEDGFALRETVAEVLQQLSLRAGELAGYGIEKPADMPDATPLMLLGGVTLVFNEYGQVKYAIGDGVFDPRRPGVQERQGRRLASLWAHGYFRPGAASARRFAAVHRNRSVGATTLAKERW